MLFDKFLGFVERHLPEYKEIATNAKLFVFDVTPHEYLPKSNPEWFDSDLFTLPFPVTAIEDKASLVIVCDMVKDAVGIHHKRKIIELIYSKTSLDHFRDTPEEREIFAPLQKEEIYTIFESEADSVMLSANKVIGHVTFNKSIYISPYNVLQIKPSDMSPWELEAVTKQVGRNAFTVLEEVIMLSHPKYFVVEETPLKMKSNPKKFPRTHERPIYTLITANDFRKKVHLDSPEREPGKHTSPIPHERRRHLRKLTVESGYKENKIIVVSASWIGISEKVVKNKRYKVIL